MAANGANNQSSYVKTEPESEIKWNVPINIIMVI